MLAKSGPGDEAERAAPGGAVLLEDVGAGDVRGHQVGRELDAAEAQVEHLGERADEQRLGQARARRRTGSGRARRGRSSSWSMTSRCPTMRFSELGQQPLSRLRPARPPRRRPRGALPALRASPATWRSSWHGILVETHRGRAMLRPLARSATALTSQLVGGARPPSSFWARSQADVNAASKGSTALAASSSSRASAKRPWPSRSARGADGSGRSRDRA